MKIAQKMIDEKRNKATDMIGKKFEVQINRKAVSIDSEKKTATFVMSTTNIDRHGDIIDQDSWILDYFLQSPMFFLNHNSDQFPIGKWIDISLIPDPDNVGKNMLVGTAEFRTEFEDAARAFRHVEEGDMNAVSVGFIPHRVEYDEETDAFILYDNELLETSLVGVGSNRQALVKSKELSDDLITTKNELNDKIKRYEHGKLISELSSREHLNKAIRLLRKSAL